MLRSSCMREVTRRIFWVAAGEIVAGDTRVPAGVYTTVTWKWLEVVRSSQT